MKTTGPTDIDSIPPGQDLDALIAETVMGWDIHFSDPGFRGGLPHWRDPENSTLYGPGNWSPSTDIEAAWKVVEKLRSYSFDFDFFASKIRVPDGKKPWIKAAFHSRTDIYSSEADTAELAISRAALKAISQEPK